MTSGIILRNYSDNDFDKYLALQVETEQIAPTGRYVSALNLTEDLERPNFRPQTDLWVAELDGKLVASLCAAYEPQIKRVLLEGCVHPKQRRRGIATMLLSHAWQAIKATGIKSAQISISETNTAAKNLLNKLGFTFIRHFLEMQLAISSVRLQTIREENITSRRLEPQEAHLLTAIQNRCFAGSWGFNTNTEEEIAYRLNMQSRSPQEVTLTCLDDRPIGYCWAIISTDENQSTGANNGLIHMLGVDPDYRRQDIGKVILHNGLKSLKARGVDFVRLTVDSENPAARSLYESVGFEIYAKTEWHERTVV